MLTDLSFIEVGQQWPPLSEAERLQLYGKNRDLFENKHPEVYYEAFKRIKRVISNFEEVVSYEVIVNYQKLITLKLADLLISENPKIAAGKHGSAEQLSVETIIKNTDLFNTGHEAIIDLSRYGDGLLYVYKDGDKGQVDVSQPPLWFPVVDPSNIKRFICHVLAWTIDVGNEKRLIIRQHYKGYYLERVCLLEGSRDLGAWYIKTIITNDKRVNNGLDDFAVVQLPNVLTSDRVHGMDDYSDIDSIISELLVRLSQISRILDKHADPSVSGPQSALERDPVLGEWKLKLGNFFVRGGKEDPPVEYITWDGQLEANFKMVEQLINLLHAISEMGGQLLGDTNQDVGVLSGTALRFKMISPLAKAKRISNRIATGFKKAIVLCSQLGGKDIVDLSNVPISITFMDGLPNDPKEEADIMAVRTGNKATMSVKRAIQVYDGMNTDDADSEIEQIHAEEEATNPMLNISTPFNGNNDPNNGDSKGGGAGGKSS